MMESIVGFIVAIFAIVIAVMVTGFAIVMTLLAIAGSLIVAFSPVIAIGLIIWLLIKILTK